MKRDAFLGTTASALAATLAPRAAAAQTPFIVGSYVVALVGFGGLAVASWWARRRARRLLTERGLGGEKGRR